MTLPIAFLLMCVTVVYLHGNPTIPGVNRNLRCVNDYLFTVYCSLAITPTDAPLDGYRLLFRQLFLPGEKKYVCQLRKTDRHYNCSFNTTNDDGLDDEYSYYLETFTDLHVFEISLCQIRHDGSENCEVLNDKYKPAKNITPNAPCHLIWDGSQYVFSWRSGYENYESGLNKKLMFQLNFYNRDHKDKVETTHNTSFSVNNLNFAPDTEYTVKVRSSPNHVLYGGQWSDWSPEVYWKTQPVLTHHSHLDPSANTIIPLLDKNVIISLCVLAPLLLLLGLVPVMKTRLRTFIPTPTPYFQSLYSECQGDFKSWVVTPSNDTGLLTAETTLQIDSLIKHTQEDSASQTHQKTIQNSPYNNIPLPDSDAALLGPSYAVTHAPSPPTFTQMKPEAIVERDSGCSFCSTSSLPSNYCTLSDTLRAFQTPGTVMVEEQQPQSS